MADDPAIHPAPIPADELRRMLFDTDVPDEELAAYMVPDPGQSRAFAPAVRINPALLETRADGSGEGAAVQGALALGGLNAISRWRRGAQYRARLSGGWTGLRLVSEGDSWFQYPFLLTDVIDHLLMRHAILSLGAAGDTLDDMIAQDEVVAAVVAERPHAVLLSGGGADLVGGGRLAAIVRPFDPRLDAAGHITAAFDAVLAELIGDVRSIARAVTAAAPGTPVLIHTYDYAIPDDGRWLGRPLRSRGIHDTALQRGIVRILIDRWAGALMSLAREPGLSGRLHVVDCRGTVPVNGWHDELHPQSAAYGLVAQKFEAEIRRVTEGARAAGASGGMKGRGALEDEALSASVLDMAARFDEAVLLSEIGRRVSVERVRAAGAMTAVPRDLTEVPASSLTGDYPALRQLGARILARAQEELHRLLCREDESDEADREMLREAFDAGQGARAAAIAGLLASGPLGLTAFVAAPVAALIVRQFLAPGWEETCTLWDEALNQRFSIPISRGK